MRWCRRDYGEKDVRRLRHFPQIMLPNLLASVLVQLIALPNSMSFADYCSVSPAKPYLCALNLHTMPNPTNKQELLSAMADGYAKDGNASEKP